MARLTVLVSLVAIFILALPACGSTPVRCTEDMPCWDCTTMGNKICG